jgi:site-specific DNA-methyltransferase (adenine-specific)
MTKGFTSGMRTSLDDTWTTPKDYFDIVNTEFNFGLDAAALQSSTLVPDNWYGPDHPDTNRKNAFLKNWVADASGKTIWLNPPYGRTIKEWTAKANLENRRGGA